MTGEPEETLFFAKIFVFFRKFDESSCSPLSQTHFHSRCIAPPVLFFQVRKMTLEELFGSTNLLSPNGPVPVSSLSGRAHLFLFFSAAWCPACRRFTEHWVRLYNTLKSQGRDFEVVFVSNDHDVDHFKEYYAQMPWLALPFQDRDRKQRLSKLFEVEGIPTVVVLDSQLHVVNKDAVEEVGRDNDGAKYPWKALSFAEAFSGALVRCPNLQPDHTQSLMALPAIALYFGASGACASFTPLLKSVFDALTRRLSSGPGVVVFVSLDRTREAYDECCKNMPWLAIPFGDPRKSVLSRMFGMETIPTLITVCPADGAVINKNGVEAAVEDPEGTLFPWAPVPPPLVFQLDHDEKTHSCFAAHKVVVYCKRATTSEEDMKGFESMAAALQKRSDAQCMFVPFFQSTLPVEAPYVCGCGHELEAQEVPDNGDGDRTCYVCSSPIYAVTYSCSACKIEVCKSCYTKRRAVPPIWKKLWDTIARVCGVDVSGGAEVFVLSVYSKRGAAFLGDWRNVEEIVSALSQI